MNKAAFEAKVMEILRENSSSRWRRHMEEGHLDPRSLHKLGSSLELFRLKEIPGKKDYAVAFVIDNSGSMDDDGKKEAAQQMAISFAESMNALRIPFSVVMFGYSPIVLHKAGSYYNRPEFRRKLDAASSCQLTAPLEGDPSALYWSSSVRSAIHGVFPSTLPGGENARKPYGGTNVICAISTAYSDIARFPGCKIVVTMSDGQIPDGELYLGARSVSPEIRRDLDALQRKKRAFRNWHNSSPQVGPCPDKGLPLDRHGDLIGMENMMLLNRYLLDKGVVPLYMGIKDRSFEDCASELLPSEREHWYPKKNVFCVHDLSQAYDAMVSKLSENFQFDHDRKLR